MSSEEPGVRSVRVFVSGRVQGVAFRWHTRERARSLGLVGWVRNLEDGRVEARLQGPQAALEAMLTFLREGPEQAHVASCEVLEELEGEFEDCTIERGP